MIRTKKALQVLTKAEQRHLTTDANVHSMKMFLRTIKGQRAMAEEVNSSHMRICADCARIARKLGV